MKKLLKMVMAGILSFTMMLGTGIPVMAADGNSLQLSRLDINSAEHPLGVDSNVYFTWNMESQEKNTNQTAYRIRVANGKDKVYDSGKVTSPDSAYVHADFKLKPMTRYDVKVKVWDNHGKTADKKSYFTTGKVDQSWKSKWITLPDSETYNENSPAFIFRKVFNIDKPVEKAFLYGTALGCYAPFLNGSRVSDDYFAPGYTQYNKRIQYNTYDVTDRMKQGENHLLAEVVPGWYSGRLAGMIDRTAGHWGTKRALNMELRIQYKDGSEDVIGTDDSWQYSTNGPIRFASFFDGETYDANKTLEGGPFHSAVIYKDSTPKIVENTGSPVRKDEKVSARNLGNGIYDFGRNFAGIIHVKLKAPKGRRVIVDHAEVLKDGKLYTESLRTAKDEITYTTRDGEQDYEPLFFYTGFRYAQLKTEPDVQIEDVYGTELHTDMQKAGDFSTSSSDLNQLQKNIMTSTKANLMDIPTDCPQRDERAGWTGDFAVFAPTAAYNYNLDRFVRKWMTDLRAAQRSDGLVPLTIPDNQNVFNKNVSDNVWGDAVIYVPWAVYESTGDITQLSENFDAMKKWMKYVERKSKAGRPYLCDAGFHFGDWLAPNTDTLTNMSRSQYTSTAHFAHASDLMTEISRILGKSSDEKYFQNLKQKIKNAYQTYLVGSDGHIKNGFQSAYVLALEMDLLTPEQRTLAVSDLVNDIEKNGTHLSTGFMGTPYILYALSHNGKTQKAYDLLFQDTCPSWLYMVRAGGTSIWERWDALTPEGEVNLSGSDSTNMVSFNHYAYGSVGDWMYWNIGGIQPVSPGYKRARICPLMDGRLSSGKASHETPYGTLAADWTANSGKFHMTVKVPCNTTAEIILPNGQKTTVGSGTYEFRCDY